MKYKLFGIAGLARTGKDTIGNYMSGAHNFHKYAFADPIKKAAHEMFDIPLNHFYDDELKEITNNTWGFSPRQIAQMLGTEGGRDLFRSDIWTKRGEIEWSNFCATNIYKAGMVFTDVRFENEADMIRLAGGNIIHVFRDNAVKVNDHVSEAGIKVTENKDSIIYNNGTIQDLCEAVDEIVGVNHE